MYGTTNDSKEPNQLQEKNNKTGGITSSDVKQYCKIMVIKSMLVSKQQIYR